MEAVYLESSVISHAVSRPSDDPVVRLLQDQARRWFSYEARRYRLVVSQFVLDEISQGDVEAASERLDLIQDASILVPDEMVREIAAAILARSLIPPHAFIDALHVASAAAAGVEYLLTQNCRHIANAHTLPRMMELLDELGAKRVLVCTPATFLGGQSDGDESNP